MTLKPALLLLALPLTACAAKEQVQPIPAVAELRQCPSYPLPPASLIKAPVTTDFLSTSGSSRPSRPSSSTN